MLSQSSEVAQATRVAARVIDGKAIVIVIDDRKLHTLNPTGTRIWELADGRTVSSIVDTISLEFQAERERVRADVEQFIENMVQLGALKIL